MLTELELQALKQSDAGARLPDKNGVTGLVRATKRGVSVSFRFRYKFKGKQYDIRVGTWPRTTLKKMREKRDEIRALLREGIDPAKERKSERLEIQARQDAKITELEGRAARVTINELFNRWHKLELSQRKDKGAEIKRAFDKDVLPTIGKMAAEDVTRAHVTGILDDILARGARRMANLQLSNLRQMFGFAYTRGIVEVDPTHRIKKADIGGTEQERDRVLSEEEIKEFSRKVSSTKLYKPTECALWIALSTCCRIGEILRARWEDVDLDTGVWRIPDENAKNGKAHTIILSEFAKTHFRILQSINHETPWCFPNRNKKSHVSPKTVTKQVADRQVSSGTKPLMHRVSSTALSLPGGRWTPHDLRRTGATLMASLGVIPEVIERCLNHTEENRVKRVYQRHDYKKEQADAWRLLGERLELLTRDDIDNVVTVDFKKSGFTK